MCGKTEIMAAADDVQNIDGEEKGCHAEEARALRREARRQAKARAADVGPRSSPFVRPSVPARRTSGHLAPRLLSTMLNWHPWPDVDANNVGRQ